MIRICQLKKRSVQRQDLNEKFKHISPTPYAMRLVFHKNMAYLRYNQLVKKKSKFHHIQIQHCQIVLIFIDFLEFT